MVKGEKNQKQNSHQRMLIQLRIHLCRRRFRAKVKVYKILILCLEICKLNKMQINKLNNQSLLVKEKQKRFQLL